MRTPHWMVVIGLLATSWNAAGATAQQAEAQDTAAGWIGISYRVIEGMAAGPVGVVAVHRDSPADRAGVRPGDQIVRWNGRADVEHAIREGGVQPGDVVEVTLSRAGEGDREVRIVAGERGSEFVRVERRGGREVVVIRPEASRRALGMAADTLAVRAESLHERLQLLLRDSIGPRMRDWEARMPQIRIEVDRAEDGSAVVDRETLVVDLGRGARLGAEFAEMNGGLGDYFGTTEGALVLRVAPGGLAERGGLQAGDVVTSVGGEPVSGVAEFRRALVAAGRDGKREVSVGALRRGEPVDLVFSVD
jgi:S1-C subfamily serine protease